MKHNERLLEYYYFAMKFRGRKFLYIGGKELNPCMPRELPRKGNGVDARKSLSIWESTGVMPECREPRLFYRLRGAKMMRDWHITEWARGCVEGVTTLQELRIDGVPESLIQSVRKAVERMRTSKKRLNPDIEN